jgi:hypothetical protein
MRVISPSSGRVSARYLWLEPLRHGVGFGGRALSDCQQKLATFAVSVYEAVDHGSAGSATS